MNAISYLMFLLGLLLPLAAAPAFAELPECPIGIPELTSSAGWSEATHTVNGSTWLWIRDINDVNARCSTGEIDYPPGPTAQSGYYAYHRPTVETAGSCPEGQSKYNGLWVRYSPSYECTLQPAEPAECSNGLLDPGEDGWDCGGVCGAPCVSTCPGDMIAGTGLYDGLCVSSTTANALGGCPAGYELDEIDDKMCIGGHTELPVEAQFGYTVPYADEEGATANPWQTSDSSFQTDILSQETVDNGDGTFTTTTVTQTTKTNPDGYQEVSTITNVETTNADGSSTQDITVNTTGLDSDGNTWTTTGSTSHTIDSDGNVTSSTSTEQTESNNGVFNADWSTKQPVEPGKIDWQPMYTLKDRLAERFPISLLTTVKTAIEDFQQTPHVPVWTFTFPLPNAVGGGRTVRIDFAPFEGFADLCRELLGFFLLLSGTLLIAKRWI